MLTTYDQQDDNREDEVNARITRKLCRLGIPTNVRGFEYLLTAVRLVYENPSLSEYITKDLYRRVARRSHAAPSTVVHAIDQIIVMLFGVGNIEQLQALFGCDGQRPTSSRFIALIAESLRDDNKKEAAAKQ